MLCTRVFLFATIASPLLVTGCFSDTGGSPLHEPETGEAGDGDGDGTEVGDGDGDGDNTEVGDGETAETGETGPEEEVCGDGAVGEGEECDDGNDIDDDECSNSCVAAVCGDGIVQEAAGEECDDGNTDAGDGCTVECLLPGAMISQTIIDFGNNSEDITRKIVIGSDDAIGVVFESNASIRFAKYDVSMEMVYVITPSPTNVNPNLAIAPNDFTVVGGQINNIGRTRQYGLDGNPNWSVSLATDNSSILDVAVDNEGFVVAAGYAGNQPVLARYNDTGGLVWSISPNAGNAFRHVAVSPHGQIYVVSQSPRRIGSYTTDNTAVWTTEQLADVVYRNLAADNEGNVYLLRESNDSSKFMLSKFDDTGALVWTVEHDDPGVEEGAAGLTLLSGGAILVAGWTNGDGNTANGLLNWYDTDGKLLHERVIDGAVEGVSRFFDVAASPTGNYAVAVGQRALTNSDSDLWIYKFEI